MRASIPLLQQVSQSTKPLLVKTSKITLQPSSPIYIYHDKVLSIKASAIDKIHSISVFQDLVKSIVYGGFYTKYRKLEGLIPFEILIGGLNNNKLSLDGTIDWAILPKKALTGYKGVALNVSKNKIPWSSGLSTIVKSGYTHVSGRGEVFINSSGEIHTFHLGPGEEVVVRRDGIVGVSVNGDELGSACSLVKFGNNEYQTENSSSDDTKSTNELKDMTLSALTSVSNAAKWVWNQISKDEFIKINGPRSVILSSDVSTSFQFTNTGSNDIEITEQQIKKSQDYLSYAIVKDGKVTFQNTPDFKESVDKIEHK